MGTRSYVVFSNKGGTGKTTLAFQLAAQYARQRKHDHVVVIDMCPQANVSQILLSTKTEKYPLRSQPGQINVFKASKRLNTVHSGKKYEQTVCGYLMAMLDKKDGEMRTFDCSQFLINVHSYNREIPGNVFLLCGDRYLDVLSKRLEQERQLSPTRHDNPWKRVTLFIKYFIDSVSEDPRWLDSCFFIDTNSNFSIYTEMAISATKRLIVPFTADDSSLSAIESMLYMVYGYESYKDERLESFKESQYFWLAQTNRIERAKLSLFVFNRVTFYDCKPAAAFATIRNRLVQILIPLFTQDANRIMSKLIFCFQPQLLDNVTIKDNYIVDVHDFHSTGIISLHYGCPISEVKHDFHLALSDSEVDISNDKNYKYYNDICKILDKLFVLK